MNTGILDSPGRGYSKEKPIDKKGVFSQEHQKFYNINKDGQS